MLQCFQNTIGTHKNQRLLPGHSRIRTKSAENINHGFLKII